MKCILFVLLLIGVNFANAQAPNQSALSLPEIMKGNEFIGHSPSSVDWTMDGKSIYFEWNPNNNPGTSSFQYTLASEKISEIPATQPIPTLNNGGSMEKTEYFLEDGNLYSFSRKSGKLLCRLKTSDYFRNLQQFEGKETIYVTTGVSIFAIHPETGSVVQLADIVKGSEPEKKSPSHWETEEEKHFQFIRELNEKNDWDQKNRRTGHQVPKIRYKSGSVSNIQIDGTGKFITFRIDQPTPSEGTHVEHHISKDGHTYTSTARAKVSDEDPTHQLGIYDLESDSTYYVDFSTLPDLRKIPSYRKDYDEQRKEYEKDRPIIMHRIVYSPSGQQNVMDIRSYDNKDRWIVQVDLKKGSVNVLDHQHDEAWIGGPGISNWNMVRGTLDWIDASTIYFQSEKTGYSHLYAANIHSGEIRALTSGNWEVHNAWLSSKKDRLYVSANKTHPGNRDFYHLMLSNGNLLPVLTNDGNHEVTVSPDEKYLAVRYSSTNQPWELYLAENKPGTSWTKITSSTTKSFKAYQWYKPEVITMKAKDGQDIYARIYEPEKDAKNGAAVIFVHGAGYLQNAHQFWSGYYREYMFHNLLRDNGFTVLDIDYRASKGYGRDYRTAIYRHMGGKDLDDQMDGRDWLINEKGIDPDRIGIYGGSYGGFITLMALLTKPGKFTCGAALRSVTDWSHYNHEYTSNILNYPNSDPEAYKKSSPMYFAENLEDKLLMLHGMVDDNVQFQDVVRLSQKFIELGKRNWELAVYPVEAHSFKKSYSWADEYRRIYELFCEELLLNNK